MVILDELANLYRLVSPLLITEWPSYKDSSAAHGAHAVERQLIGAHRMSLSP